MSHSYYEKLGILPDASPEEIRASYRRLALRYHPDKAKDQTDINRFIEIKQAYETLSDPAKRIEYDDPDKYKMDDMVNYMVVAMMSIYNNWKESQERIMMIDLKVTLEEIYNKRVKKLVLKVKRYDAEIDLPYNSSVTLYIPLESYESEYLFKEMGDETRGRKRDILIKLIIEESDVQIDTVLSRFDLFIERPITLYDYYYTTEFQIPFFNSTVLSIPYTTGKRVALVKEHGLPYWDCDTEEDKRGDLYIHFRLDLPDHLIDPDELEPYIKKYFS